MYLTSLIHRDRLFQIACRWLGDRLEPDDGRALTEIFIFEQPVITPSMVEIMGDIYREIHPDGIQLRRITSKDELRRAIVAGCADPDERMKALFDRYAEFPEEYFPRTPVDLILATDKDSLLLGMTRFKSVRRIADKASRRIIDRLSGEIQATARALAGMRAQQAGVPLDRLVSSAEIMAEDFIHAERAVSRSFEAAAVPLTPNDIHIDDVVGFKFIGPPSRLETIQAAIAGHPKVHVAEMEIHSGEYNDTNLLIDFQLPPAGTIIDRLRDQDWSYAERRGLRGDALRKALPPFVESGARNIRAEVILTTFEELVESEFGRSIHEERIIRQRSRPSYAGRIAQNAACLIEYMLMLALSPQVEVADLPIKMWGRYLPEMVAATIWNLFGIEPVVNPIFADLGPLRLSLKDPSIRQ